EMQELASEVLTGRTVLLVTHDPGEAARLADRIYLMGGGAMRQVSAPNGRAIRPVDAPEVMRSSAELLAALRAA
ncbi:MAG: ABC transporter ATP-binding protein, partial [Pseudomonadota bacterium]